MRCFLYLGTLNKSHKCRLQGLGRWTVPEQASHNNPPLLQLGRKSCTKILVVLPGWTYLWNFIFETEASVVVRMTLELQVMLSPGVVKDGVSWGGLSLAGCQVFPQAAPSLSSSWTGERRCSKRLLGWDWGRERSLTFTTAGKTKLTWGN